MAKVLIGSAGVLQPGRWRWLRALGWMIALGVAVAGAFNLVGYGVLDLIVAIKGEHYAGRADIPQSYKLIGTVLGAAAALIAYAVTVRLGERRKATELRLPPLLPEWLAGCAISALMMTAIVGSMWSFGWVTLSAQPITSIARALRDSIQAGVIEEILIRLIIFRMLWRAFGIWPALIVAGSFFGIIHISNPGGTALGALVIVAGEGVGFGLYLLTGRIWASIGAHMAWNFTQGWVYGAAVSGFTAIAGGPLRMEGVPGVPEMFSGGSFGPESTVSALAVSVLGSVAILMMAWRRGHFAAADGDRKVATQPSG